MPDYAVSPDKNKLLQETMEALNVCESEIIERFIRSSGHGGQNVNKRSSCVYLKHSPTGIEVKCMTDRSQSVNRFLARRLLLEKIEGHILGSESKTIKAIDKVRKQKQRRRRRTLLKNNTDKE